MPNGGSDCCGTCWFNVKNKGQAGYNHADDPEADYCSIREIAIEDPFYNYCGNHPHRRPNRDPVPIGPIFVAADDGGRKPWKPSPDTEDVRLHLLELLGKIGDVPEDEYPLGFYTAELVVWELGELRERRALPELNRIVEFDPETQSGRFGRTQKTLVSAAKEALIKIVGNV
jgi:hypothetical protein